MHRWRAILVTMAFLPASVGHAEPEATFQLARPEHAQSAPFPSQEGLAVRVKPGHIEFNPTCLLPIEAPAPFTTPPAMLEVHATAVDATGVASQWSAYFALSCASRAVTVGLADLDDGKVYQTTALLTDANGPRLWTSPMVRAEPSRLQPSPAVAH